MAFAKAEALTMVCMKNRFWTLIAEMKVKNDIWLKNLVFTSLRRLPNEKIREPQNFDILKVNFHSDQS